MVLSVLLRLPADVPNMLGESGNSSTDDWSYVLGVRGNEKPSSECSPPVIIGVSLHRPHIYPLPEQLALLGHSGTPSAAPDPDRKIVVLIHAWYCCNDLSCVVARLAPMP